MRRGDLVTVALKEAFGKPRPALIIQSDLFSEHPSLTVLPITSELRDTPLFRLTIEPGPGNGLEARCQIMVDKAQTVPRDTIGSTIGRLPDEDIVAVNRALAVFLGFA